MQERTEKLSFREKFLFGIGEIPSAVSDVFISTVFTIYVSDLLGISPIISGLVIMVGRIWAFFCSPIMGFVTDRTDTRWGRRRPYFLFTAVPMGLFFALTFIPYPIINPAVKTAILFLSYILFITCNTAFRVPYLAYMTEMTEDYSQRTSINIYREFFSVIATIIAYSISGFGNILFSNNLIAELFYKIKGIERSIETESDNALFFFATIPGIIIALLMTAVCLIVYKTSRERYTYIKPKVFPNVGTQLGDSLKNVSFKSLLVIFLGVSGGIAFQMGFAIYYYTNVIDIAAIRNNNPLFVALFFLIPFVVALLLLPFWTVITRKFGKKLALIIPVSLWLVSQIGWAIVNPDMQFYVIIIIFSITGIGMSATGIIPWAMLPDTVDQDEIGSGERKGGIHSGLMIMASSIGGVLAVFSMKLILRTIGYIPGIEQSPTTLEAIRWTMCFGPMIFIIIALVGAFLYPITKERYAEIRMELEKLRKERMG